MLSNLRIVNNFMTGLHRGHNSPNGLWQRSGFTYLRTATMADRPRPPQFQRGWRIEDEDCGDTWPGRQLSVRCRKAEEFLAGAGNGVCHHPLAIDQRGCEIDRDPVGARADGR